MPPATTPISSFVLLILLCRSWVFPDQLITFLRSSYLLYFAPVSAGSPPAVCFVRAARLIAAHHAARRARGGHRSRRSAAFQPAAQGIQTVHAFARDPSTEALVAQTRGSWGGQTPVEIASPASSRTLRSSVPPRRGCCRQSSRHRWDAGASLTPTISRTSES